MGSVFSKIQLLNRASKIAKAFKKVVKLAKIYHISSHCYSFRICTFRNCLNALSLELNSVSYENLNIDKIPRSPQEPGRTVSAQTSAWLRPPATKLTILYFKIISKEVDWRFFNRSTFLVYRSSSTRKASYLMLVLIVPRLPSNA